MAKVAAETEGPQEPLLSTPTICRDCLPAPVEGVLAVTGCCALDYVFHNKYCATLFRCHCTWPWAGGAGPCNIHHPTGPKCPWCNVQHNALKWLAFAITDKFTVALMLLSYAIVWALQTRAVLVMKPLMRPSAAVATFLVWGFLMGLTFYLGTDYPCFLWIKDETDCGFKQ